MVSASEFENKIYIFVCVCVRAQTLTTNYRVWCSRHNRKVPDDLDIRIKVEEVLVECGMQASRARSMEQEDFMKLLLAFNKADIHFS